MTPRGAAARGHRRLWPAVALVLLSLSAAVFAAAERPAPPETVKAAATRPTAADAGSTAAADVLSPEALRRPAPRPVSSPPPPAPPALPQGEPTSLHIPAIGVRTPLVRLGVDDSGAMEVPRGPDYDLAGWYVHGPRPGEVGPAVVAGHVDSRRGPSVFFRLRELQPGDTVEVGYGGGEKVVFTVTAREQYPKAAFPTEKVFGTTPVPTLRLITCGGSFDYSTRHYRDNIVVYARLATSRA